MFTMMVRAIVLIGAITLYVLSWEGNIGKGLACIVSPGSLEVTGVGITTATTGTEQSGHSNNQSGGTTTT